MILSSPKTLIRGALVAAAPACLALFGFALAAHLASGSLCCADDAFIATVAKNLARGDGYASTYSPSRSGETAPRRFDPLITTGPVLVVPAAVLVRAWGNRYWVPGLVVVVASLVLLAAVFEHSFRATQERSRWAVAVIGGLAALVLATIGYFEHWYALLGEIPALLLLALGTLHLLGGRRRARDLAWGGLLLGCAVQTKALAVMALPVIVAFLLLERTSGAAKPRAVAVTFVCAVLPTVAFETYKLADLGVSGYRTSTAAAADYVQRAPGSGIRELVADPVGHVGSTLPANWRALVDYFDAGWAAVAFLAALVLGLLARGRWRGDESRIPLALIAVAAGYALWWLSISGKIRIRYLLIGLGLFCLGTVFDLVLGRWSRRKSALALALALTLLPRARDLGVIAPPRPLGKPSERTEAMLDTARFLELHGDDRVLAADWWATAADMEYLLDGSSRFVHHATLERRGSPPVLLLDDARWSELIPENRERFRATVARLGATIAWERGSYRVYAAPPLEPDPPR